MHGRIVVALGGNAILQSGQRGTLGEQKANIGNTAEQIARMIKAGYEVVLTHGNGPQVGAAMIRHETAASIVPPMPMDCCGAETQGFIGYLLGQAIDNALAGSGVRSTGTICVVTRVEVDPDDEAFLHPTKPVGPFYSSDVAAARMKQGEKWMEDAGRGWRRIVPSPLPKKIIEGKIIRYLVDAGFLVIASGGGGIPVVMSEGGTYLGIEAVIDKDLAGECLASEVGAEIFMILTDVPGVAVDFNSVHRRWVRDISASMLAELLEEGHFGTGSMKPKVEAVLHFIESGGKRAVISSLENAVAALDGKAGTVVVP